jgi:branched-chain amino acid transport system substrate-binding protein
MSFPFSQGRSASRAVAAALPMLAAALAGCGSGTQETLVLGVVGPFEASYGASMKQGAQLAQHEINERGGIRGRTLELRIRDDRADPQAAIAIADEFRNDPSVLAVVGHVNSSTMIAAAPVYQAGLTAVSTSATSPEVSRLGDWVFRVATSDSANAVELARLARRLDVPTAILYANDDYGRGLAISFRSALLAEGASIVESDPYLESTEDFRPYLERLRRKNAGLIFIAGLEGGASRIIAQARDLGLQARFLGADGLEGLVVMGPAYDGTLVGLLYHPHASPAARQFAERFRAAYGREPDSFAALGYDATHLLARAIESVGPDREAIRDYIASVGRDRSPAYPGATGTIRFDEHGDPVGKGYAAGEIRDGKIHLSDQI